MISSNRADGAAAVACIAEDIGEDGSKPGRPALEQLLAKRGVRHVSYADWQRIDGAEIANATPPAPRRKFTTLDEMLAVLDG